MTRSFAIAAGLFGLASAGNAQEAALPDKSAYTIFNRTPDEFMRELNADRPDKTDCPFTVDAGHFQVEMDFANLTYNRPNSQRGNVQSTAFDVVPMNLKVGLLNNLDFQLVFTPFHWERNDNRDSRKITQNSGFEGMTPRFKVNLLGNDGGFLAVALIPFLKLPTSQDHLGNGGVEGGLGIPYAFDIPGWEVGLQTTFRFNCNETGGGRHTEFDNSISIGHRVVGNLSGYVEFFSNVSREQEATWVGTVDTWLTYQFNKSLRLDGGVYIGVTRAADDWHPWIGMTWRY